MSQEVNISFTISRMFEVPEGDQFVGGEADRCQRKGEPDLQLLLNNLPTEYRTHVRREFV
jgi:hypothetical protein